MKQKMISYLSTCDVEFENLCKYMYENPEESYKEKEASKEICNLLKKHDFNIETEFLDIPNAFIATKGNTYPRICFLCQYDAIKDKGHITAHNALTTTSCIAGVCLGEILKHLDRGSVVIIGCPGEYLGGTKDVMLKQGIFNDIDAVLMAHPDITTCESGSSSAIIPLSIQFKGEDGLSFLSQKEYSSLDAVLLTFSILNTLMKGFPEGVEVNYILSEGGKTPLLIPLESEAKFFIRAKNIELALVIENKIREIARYVGKLMKVSPSYSLYEPPYEELVSNTTLNRLFSHNFKECGVINICHNRDINAGISLGAISKKVPAIHPYFSIIEDEKTQYGTSEFAKCTVSEFGLDMCKKAGLALAFTGLDLITNDVLLNEAKSELSKK